MKRIREYSAEIITLLGCVCILYGLSMWNVILAWIVAGVMCIVFGTLIALNDAKEKTKNAIAE